MQSQLIGLGHVLGKLDGILVGLWLGSAVHVRGDTHLRSEGH